METNKYQNKRLKLISDLVDGKKVLDIGYASMPNPYLNKFYSVGYDILKAKRKKIYNEEIKGDVRDIKKKLNNRKFNTIICGEFIEHLENPYQFLRDIKDLLEENGKLILSTPNPMGFPMFLFEMFRSKKFFYSKDHIYCFLPRWVERMLKITNYKLIKIKPVGIYLPLLHFFWCPISFSYQLIYVAKKL